LLTVLNGKAIKSGAKKYDIAKYGSSIILFLFSLPTARKQDDFGANVELIN
jgi:hypothetical protein